MVARIIFLGIYLFLEIVAVVLIVTGNVVVIYVMIYKKKLKKPSHSFIVSVAIADLLIGVVAIPEGIWIAIKLAPPDYDSCMAATIAVLIVYFVSLTTLPVISTDRFWAICRPVHYRTYNTRRINAIIIGISWICGICLGTFTLFENIPREKYANYCTFTNIMTLRGTMIASLTTPTISLLMIVIYFFIFRKIRTMVRADEIRKSGQISLKSSEVKWARTFAFIIGSYVIFWAPMTIHCLIIAFSGNADFFNQHWSLRIIKIFCVCASHYNSALNPLIYAYQIKDIRDTMRRLLKMKAKEDIPMTPASHVITSEDAKNKQ